MLSMVNCASVSNLIATAKTSAIMQRRERRLNIRFPDQLRFSGRAIAVRSNRYGNFHELPGEFAVLHVANKVSLPRRLVVIAALQRAALVRHHRSLIPLMLSEPVEVTI